MSSMFVAKRVNCQDSNPPIQRLAVKGSEIYRIAAKGLEIKLVNSPEVTSHASPSPKRGMPKGVPIVKSPKTQF